MKGDEENGVTGSNYADLFLAKKDEKGKWKQPEVVESEVNSDSVFVVDKLLLNLID